MKKKILIGLVILILAAVTFGLYSLNKSLDKSGMNGMQANGGLMPTTTSLEKRNIVSVIQATGNVKAEESEEFPLDPGKKVTYYVKDGEAVTKGRLMYKIIDPELDLQYKQALENKKQITNASTASSSVSAGAANVTNMAAQGPSLMEINSQINSLKERLEANNIRAPFSGIISISSNSAGSQGNMPTTLKLSNHTSLIIPVNIEEVDYPLIKIGQKATVKLTAYGNQTFQGTVSRISKEAFNKDGTVTIPVEIKLAQNSKILPGLSAEVSISINSKNNVLALPSEYIQQNEKGENFVNIRPLGSNNNSAKNSESSAAPSEVRIVKIGLKDDTHTEIISGLKEGDVVQADVPQASAQNSVIK